jgi:hypothetical protein
LENLEAQWIKKSSAFKIKKSRKYILPRKNQSMALTIIGFLVLTYSILIDKGEKNFLSTIGVVLFFIKGQELYKWWKYSQALKDYEEEKERLEMAIQRLI